MNKREYTFRLKNIYLKLVVPDKVSALIHTHSYKRIQYTEDNVYKYVVYYAYRII